MNKKLVAFAIAAVVGFAVIGVVTNAFAPVVNQYFDQQEAASNIRDRVTDAEYAQREYEWFKQQEQKINAMQEKIENQRRQIRDFKEVNGESAEDWSYQQQKQYNRMTNRLLGYRNQYENLVADYNAKMNMETRNLYNNSLPLEMEKKFWTGDLIP